ncbi:MULTISPECIES: DUF4097 family beta strand repeat-containing protein [unclassified Nocardioides]|uniref:DUF4097 family beta strand repeat-containing protein n=1 Tax=unclassified Nocardioides TaxID=2615069 RepID=UPI000701FDF0|nr:MULTISPECIES: DUF4097 family beta strand repeat-containing protein [unclassified Nocardioides]KQY57126.1 hypothetical protein ASD30_12800 [Nocardioides sp. Root140]KRF11767.1 hypothetical protein ASH02_17450 [Nocardioides sp. Soil796]
MERIFETPASVELYVELGRGSLNVTAADVGRTTVSLTGKNADQVSVEQNGDGISVIAPKERSGFFGGNESHVDAVITVPSDSRLVTKTGSADQHAEGRFALGNLKSGSGDVSIGEVTGALVINTGSGAVTVGQSGGDLRLKSGSGDVRIEHAAGTVGVSTGSGDVTIAESEGPVILKSGSGDVAIGIATGEVTAQTASGDVTVKELVRGSLNSKNASGDIRVGIPAGIPVWTDVNTVSGRIASDLAGAGQPDGDQDYIELRATTVSGDITLKQL